MENLPDFFFSIAAFVFGLLIGSFLNVVIYRVPRDESIILPHSHCPNCDTAIRSYDNIPVLSYAILGGRCRNCRVRISPIYPGVELLVAILYVLVYLKDGRSIALPGDILFVSLIVPLVFIDLEHKLLPDAITIPGLFALLMLRLLDPGLVIASLPAGRFGLTTAPDLVLCLLGSALGALAGGGSLWLIRELYLRLRKVEGMGLGDVKMMMMVGVFLGWQLSVLTIFVASLAASLFGVFVILANRGSMKSELAFGVWLGPAAIMALFTGQQFIKWYVSFYR